MRFIEKLRSRYYQQYLKKEASSINVRRRSIALEQAKTIGILFDGTIENDRNAVLQFCEELKNSGKSVTILAFINQKLEPGTEYLFSYFDKKSLDWTRRPQPETVSDFENQEFDILLNLSPKVSEPLDYIAARSKARFRVGPFSGNILSYDLMIDCEWEKGVSHFLKQVLIYLGKLNAKSPKSIAVPLM
jgi:hypothetical protein